MRHRFILGATLALTVVWSNFSTVCFAVQNSSTLTQGITVQLSKVTTIAGNTSADVLYGTYVPGDSRLFLVQKSGVIRYINPNTTNDPGTVMLDLNSAGSGMSGFLQTDSEKGLLGMAFSPDFNTVGAAGFHKFYTYTSEDSTKLGTADFLFPESATTPVNNYAVLREWTANAGVTGITGSSRVIVKVADPQPQHNGGTIEFSPVDHYLYWAMGDGGGNSSNPDSLNGISNTSDGHANSDGVHPHGNAQDRTVMLGKMIRINPLSPSETVDPNANVSANGQYQIPKNNPFTLESNINPATSQPYANYNSNWKGEIYAYGLRNPYRWSFDQGAKNNPNDPNRGKLIVADVGFVSREEVDVIQSGGNYGWVMREGTLQPPAVNAGNPAIPNYIAPVNAITGLPDTLVDPIAEYDHTVGTATIGGFVYHGSRLPALEGMFIFGDYQNKLSLNTGNGILFYVDPNQVVAPGTERTIHYFGISASGVSLPASGLQGFGEDTNGEIYALFDNGTVITLVPEPATWGLLAIGMAGIGLQARRRARISGPARGT